MAIAAKAWAAFGTLKVKLLRDNLKNAGTSFLPVQKAQNLNDLSVYLAADGDFRGALTSAYEAVSIFRRMEQADLAGYEPDFAQCLNTLANRISESGNHRGALVPGQEAVCIRRRLIQINPNVYEPDLAQSLGVS